MMKRRPVTGPRPGDSYDAIVRAHNKATKRLVEELRRRYFDVEGKSTLEITDLVMRGEIQKRRPDRRAS
jgi:hypothetical protein